MLYLDFFFFFFFLWVHIAQAEEVLNKVLSECTEVDAEECAARLTKVALRNPFAHFYLGLVAQQRNEDHSFDEARKQYETVLNYYGEHADSLTNLGKLWSDAGDKQKAFELWEKALRVEPNHRMARVNLALALHAQGLYTQAMDHWKILMAKDVNDAEAAYNAGVSLQFLGQASDAAQAYAQAVAARPEYPEALINLAAIHHRFGSLSDALFWYRQAIQVLENDSSRHELLVMVHNNFGVALSQLGEARQAVASHEAALDLAKELDLQDDIDYGYGHLHKARIPVNDWRDRELQILKLVHRDTQRINSNAMPVLLPFDTLLLPVDADTRLRHALALSKPLENMATSRNISALVSHQIDTPISLQPPRVSYVCYDFNDHPTAHLVQGLFRWHRRLLNFGLGTYASAINYGKDDGSMYRETISREARTFLNVHTLGHNEAVLLARSEIVPEIAVDLQGHTLGTRMELMALRIAPIQASYLIFPGTSGAPGFIDYILLDRFVVPPDDSIRQHYSEKLVYLPGSYQVNDYEDFALDVDTKPMNASLLRDQNRLPAKATIVFCNFNKNDKLDPESFGLWMSILSRVPGSVLWMLSPSKSAASDLVQTNLRAEAAARGVHPNRLIWAPRLPKPLHLKRHAAADLFLDTLVYGAHSTATDAMRGGLPLLTVRGHTFPQRVGISLLSAISSEFETLACSSLKEFEDLAVSLTTQDRSVLKAISRRLQFIAPIAPLFDTALSTASMDRAFRLMCDLYKIDGDAQFQRHIVLGKNSLDGTTTNEEAPRSSLSTKSKFLWRGG